MAHWTFGDIEISVVVVVAYEMMCLYCASGSSYRESSPSVIVAHPDFRMFVLANRPGFPFLGNDFFGAMGMHVDTDVPYLVKSFNVDVM